MGEVEHVELSGAEGGEKETGAAWTLVAAGDFALGGGLEAGKGGELVDPRIEQWVGSAGLAMANFEGAMPFGQKPILKIGPHVEMGAGAPLRLREMGFAVAGLANNHTMDFGGEALARTIDACRECGLNTCGAGAGMEAAMKPAQARVGGTAVSVFSFCEQEFGVTVDERAGTAPISHARALASVGAARARGEVVVVAAHGGVENVPFSPLQRRDQLRGFVDAGASVVVGHHPHVMQGWEQYGHGLIFHSVGNFFFQPGFATGGEGRWSFAVRVRMSGRRATGFDLLPVCVDESGRLRAGGDEPAWGQRAARLKRISGILAREETAGEYWRELALHLWERRYRRLLEEACGGGPMTRARTLARPLAQRYRARRSGSPEPMRMSAAVWRQLLLLNLWRTESHRWTVETALAELGAGRRGRERVREELGELLG